MPEARTRSTRRTRKIAAIAAGALVVGIGGTYTLATWTDSEWVWGGANGTDAIGTSEFEVQQNTTTPLDADEWTDEESNAGGALIFGVNALALSPGDTVYAPVSLRASAGSLAGDVTLSGAVPASGITAGGAESALWQAVTLSVYTSDAATAPACATGFAAEQWDAVPGLTDASLSAGATGAQRLSAGATSADPGAPQHYCFSITLPDTAANQTNAALQGTGIAPAWEFESESVLPASVEN